MRQGGASTLGLCPMATIAEIEIGENGITETNNLYLRCFQQLMKLEELGMQRQLILSIQEYNLLASNLPNNRVRAAIALSGVLNTI